MEDALVVLECRGAAVLGVIAKTIYAIVFAIRIRCMEVMRMTTTEKSNRPEAGSNPCIIYSTVVESFSSK